MTFTKEKQPMTTTPKLNCMSPRVMEFARDAGFELPEVWSEKDAECLEKFANIILDHCSETVRGVLRDHASSLSYEDADLLQTSIRELLTYDIDD